MRVLLTGGAGFIGSHLAERLLQEGCDVLTVDKLTYCGRLENLSGVTAHPRHQFLQADICDEKAMRSAFAEFRPDAVLHLAAETHVDRSIADDNAFVTTNVMGTLNLLHCARHYLERRSGFRFVHISTDEVFGSMAGQDIADEETPYRPSSPYAASKAAADMLVQSYRRTYDFPAIIVHPSNTYGPRQYPEKLIPLMISRALAGQELPVYGSGMQSREWLHVEDHVDGIWQVLTRGTLGESYCLSANTEIKNLDLVTRICSMLDEIRPLGGASYRAQIRHVADRPGHDARYASSCEKIRRELGWEPRMPFDSGLRATVEWYAAR